MSTWWHHFPCLSGSLTAAITRTIWQRNFTHYLGRKCCFRTVSAWIAKHFSVFWEGKNGKAASVVEGTWDFEAYKSEFESHLWPWRGSLMSLNLSFSLLYFRIIPTSQAVVRTGENIQTVPMSVYHMMNFFPQPPFPSPAILSPFHGA